MQTVSSLVNQISASAAQNVALYQWAMDNLLASERQRFDHRRQRLIHVISELEAVALKSTQPALLERSSVTAMGAEQMDTVPSQMFDLPSTSERQALDGRWIATLRPSHVARMYLSGQWAHAQLIWVDPQQEVFLWVDCRSDAAWPIKRSALSMLQRESLAAAYEPRSLVKESARLVASRITGR
jgi:hypothetical protein